MLLTSQGKAMWNGHLDIFVVTSILDQLHNSAEPIVITYQFPHPEKIEPAMHKMHHKLSLTDNIDMDMIDHCIKIKIRGLVHMMQFIYVEGC